MPKPDPHSLLGLFPPADYLRDWTEVPAAQVPEPYRSLLDHEHHMTVTVEAHHGDEVAVRVLEKHVAGESYARKILLALKRSGRVVQFGLVRIHFAYCNQEVRDEIVSERTPLGRVLIKHDVLRRIEPTAFVRVTPGPALVEWFGRDAPTYGRFALIYCDGRPAIELLEIVTGIEKAS